MKNNHQSIFAAQHAGILFTARAALFAVRVYFYFGVRRQRQGGGLQVERGIRRCSLAQAISSSTHPRHDLGDFTPDGLLCACEGEVCFASSCTSGCWWNMKKKNRDKKTCAHILAKRINDTRGSLWSFCNFRRKNVPFKSFLWLFSLGSAQCAYLNFVKIWKKWFLNISYKFVPIFFPEVHSITFQWVPLGLNRLLFSLRARKSSGVECNLFAHIPQKFTIANSICTKCIPSRLRPQNSKTRRVTWRKLILCQVWL